MNPLNFELVVTPDVEHEDHPMIFKCDGCGKISHMKDCDSYQECESWEMPALYTILVCPHCKEAQMEPHALSMNRFLIAWHNLTKSAHTLYNRILYPNG